jgi:hypothetical protein
MKESLTLVLMYRLYFTKAYTTQWPNALIYSSLGLNGTDHFEIFNRSTSSQSESTS